MAIRNLLGNSLYNRILESVYYYDRSSLASQVSTLLYFDEPTSMQLSRGVTHNWQTYQKLETENSKQCTRKEALTILI